MLGDAIFTTSPAFFLGYNKMYFLQKNKYVFKLRFYTQWV